MNGEIVSCTGFEGDRFFVTYQIVLPEGWALRAGNLSDGYTEQEVGEAVHTTEDGIKVTGAELLQSDGYRDGNDAEGLLQGATSTALARQRRHDSVFTHRRGRYRARGVPYSLDHIK